MPADFRSSRSFRLTLVWSCGLTAHLLLEYFTCFSWSTSFSATYAKTHMQTHMYLDRWIDRHKLEVLLNSLYTLFFTKMAAFLHFLIPFGILCFTFYSFGNCWIWFFLSVCLYNLKEVKSSGCTTVTRVTRKCQSPSYLYWLG